MDMCRFFGTGDPQYRTVAAAIERVLQNLPTKLQPGLVRLQDGMESDNSGTPVVPPRTEDSHQMDNFCPVLESRDPGQADARQNLIDLLQFDQIDARLMTLKTAQAKTAKPAAGFSGSPSTQIGCA
jgi:hypothetical protein